MNNIKPTLKPRRIAVQTRSRATVDAIIQAATYILTEVGWEGLTTNAIASRAGVNIGSLYQFFPNKQAVIAELQRRHAVATRGDLRKSLELLSEQFTLRQALTRIIEISINEHRIAPAVHKVISEELPSTVKCMDKDQEEFRAQCLSALKPLMQNVPTPELAIYTHST